MSVSAMLDAGRLDSGESIPVFDPAAGCADYPIFIVTAELRILSRSRAAFPYLLRSDLALRIRGEQLQARTERDQRQLTDAVRHALAGKRDALLLEGSDGGALAVVSPWNSTTPSAAVLLERRSACSEPILNLFAQRAGLTPAETMVLSDLATGLSPQDIAEGQCVSVHTVRTHIRAVLTKLQCSGLRELLVRLARLPSLAG